MTQNEENSTLDHQASSRKLRTRLIVGGLVVLFILALVLTPPYINVNRYRRRITTTMSQSLGRPVHLDNVTLHLLPVPGLTLSNLVVSEDPAFGYEPVIRANTVEATLRAGSLWRRHVEFSTIRFIEPSLNLVRNGQGKWNLEDVLMQASHVETAPTEQRSASAKPRFPYIEATGARVNVKIENEKKPFSLSDAQFALWLPSPQLWRVRMRGKPARTDTNVSQTGEFTLEGSLQRAPKTDNVPVDLRASWNAAPLGEASHLFTGKDAGWRGTVFSEAHMIGPLSHTAVAIHVQLNDLRRADFVPAQPLDVTVDCTSTADIARATLTDASCAVPTGGTKPVALLSPFIDLEKPKSSQASLVVTSAPLAWAMNWIKLFAQEVPASIAPAGDVSGALEWNRSSSSWQGVLTAKLPPAKPDTTQGPKLATPEQPTLAFAIDTDPSDTNGSVAPIARLLPTTLHPAPASTFTLSGVADSNGYGLQLSGTGTNSQALALANALPPLNQGVAGALIPESRIGTHVISISCSRLWSSGAQVCIPVSQPSAKPARPKHHH